MSLAAVVGGLADSGSGGIGEDGEGGPGAELRIESAGLDTRNKLDWVHGGRSGRVGLTGWKKF